MHTVQKTSRTVTRFAGHPDEIEALVEQAKHPQPPADAPPMYPCPCCEKPTAWYVGQWLKIVLRREQKATEAENVLAGYGIKVSSYTDEDSGRLPSDALGCQPGDQCIVIAHTNVHRLLLRGTSWEGKSIDKIITRIPGAMRARRRIGGVKLHSVMVPMLYLNEHVFSDTETDESEPVGF
jgi:hypothetical protein